MKKKTLFLFSLFIGLGLVSCSQEADGYYEDSVGSIDAESKNDVVVDTDRKIIYTASYTITYEEENAIEPQVTNKVKEMGGYTSSINQYSTKQIYVYKVPVAKFNDFLDYVDAFEGTGEKEVSSTDITNDYSYTEARISTLTSSKTAYQNLLASATSVDEIILLTDKIADIDTELQSLNLKMTTYTNKIDYSEVTITYYEERVYTEPSFFDEYWEYVGDFFIGFGKFILYLLPIAVTGGAIFCAIYFPVRYANKKKASKKHKEEQH